MRVTCIVGARPNFMKVAPILAAMRPLDAIEPRLVHTGQHYDERMSTLFFRELGLPQPDAYLGVGSGSHAVQTARVMELFDADLDQHPADVVLVVGDVNSTIACALVAAKRGVGVAHVEAGLRSRDRQMPEEINRVLTDQISDWLFTSERSALDNLVAEGIDPARVHFVGNVMIDTLVTHRAAAARRPVLADLGCTPKGYAIITLHRPSNVDTPEAAANTVRAVEAVAARLPTIIPFHPRTSGKLQQFGLLDRVTSLPGVRVVEPQGYLDFLCLMDNAALVFTDSGGIQEETTALGVPCLTFRDSTERPITVTEGTNVLLGTDAASVPDAVEEALKGRRGARVPEYWDGKAAERIVAVLSRASS
ncbi:UDP-N-acetylglucosamine 2-epimerase (non-hydrolyzing) [Luteitalea sp. TBR-22]|uniref:non-hydrolyzing UDP-N-acetylglucosamine 2-epimerase n=1 Tax=Luteitalea sp. TBR-22 TaxID=2802971 RepID=UPI001AF26932|nr:UDP-N-acetylglucosamine 2-epimerase (non-hydrolyzing) [Luteitalea sp. TBR-22]BCS33168.1 UDP-N-acetylglucosamine 2-epimerase (non-hydrolyzing) [Luteitalea sp. TBR-22]